ncbi:MAG: hypothetical protein JSW58_07525 [Candidatus Latescibacterota bacterium]|nr:MAG: hypothetical protein JSW58_07525 [Candidatus Latescibacterota bacterium]
MTSLFIILVVLIFGIAQSLRVVRENERYVVFRLGRFHDILGPGLVFLIPMLDKYEKVKLGERYPGWQDLERDVLYEKIKMDYVFKGRSS